MVRSSRHHFWNRIGFILVAGLLGASPGTGAPLGDPEDLQTVSSADSGDQGPTTQELPPTDPPEVGGRQRPKVGRLMGLIRRLFSWGKKPVPPTPVPAPGPGPSTSLTTILETPQVGKFVPSMPDLDPGPRKKKVETPPAGTDGPHGDDGGTSDPPGSDDSKGDDGSASTPPGSGSPQGGNDGKGDKEGDHSSMEHQAFDSSPWPPRERERPPRPPRVP